MRKLPVFSRTKRFTPVLIALVVFGGTLAAAMAFNRLRDGSVTDVAALVRRAEAAQPQMRGGDVVSIQQTRYQAGTADPLSDPYHRKPEPDGYTNVQTVLRLGPDMTIIERHLTVTDMSGGIVQEEYSLGANEAVFTRADNAIQTFQGPPPTTFVMPVAVSEIAAAGMRSAGTTMANGTPVKLLERAWTSADAAVFVDQWGLAQRDGGLVMRRRYQVTPAGERMLRESTVVDSIVVNPPLPADAFVFRSQNVPSDNSFSPPPDHSVPYDVAQAEAPFEFVATGFDGPAIFRGSRPPIDWTGLTANQRSIQYATSISHAYRLTGSAGGTRVMIIEGPYDEMMSMLANTPPTWATSREVAVRGATASWVGSSQDMKSVFFAGRRNSTLIVATAAGLSEDALVELVAPLFSGAP